MSTTVAGTSPSAVNCDSTSLTEVRVNGTRVWPNYRDYTFANGLKWYFATSQGATSGDEYYLVPEGASLTYRRLAAPYAGSETLYGEYNRARVGRRIVIPANQLVCGSQTLYDPYFRPPGTFMVLESDPTGQTVQAMQLSDFISVGFRLVYGGTYVTFQRSCRVLFWRQALSMALAPLLQPDTGTWSELAESYLPGSSWSLYTAAWNQTFDTTTGVGAIFMSS